MLYAFCIGAGAETNIFLFSLFFFLLLDLSSAIKLMDVLIPPHAIRGQNAKLTCSYDLEGDKLYSIKWYRNGHEFYRYIPSDNPKTTIFNGNGINVDVSIKYNNNDHKMLCFLFFAIFPLFLLSCHLFRQSSTRLLFAMFLLS